MPCRSRGHAVALTPRSGMLRGLARGSVDENGQCRQDGLTIGFSGTVTCGGGTGANVVRCSTSVGCFWLPRSYPVDGFCGDPSDGLFRYKMTCDGPNDCPSGQVCCAHWGPDFSSGGTSCFSGDSCPADGDERYYAVCDPSASKCPYQQHCKLAATPDIGTYAYCVAD